MSVVAAGAARGPVSASRSQLLALAALVRRRTGIAITETQLPQLAAAVNRIRPALSAEEVSRLSAGRERRVWVVDRLIEEVTVKETYFFRNHSELERIRWRPDLRVWDPGCATGEEAYTLAVMALETLGSAAATVSILATDVAAYALVRARRGTYTARSARNIPAPLRDLYFRATATGEVEAGESLRRQVRFTRHNLVADPVPPAGGPFDVIVCRNVLIYFDAETAKRTVQALRGALASDGLLVLGAADRLSVPGALPLDATAKRAAPHEPLSGPSAEEPLAPARPDSLDPEAAFRLGLALQARGDAPGAVAALRRALYVAPDFGYAAFQLGRAHEARGEAALARSRYQQGLSSLEATGPQRLLEGREAAVLALACRARLDWLVREAGSP